MLSYHQDPKGIQYFIRQLTLHNKPTWEGEGYNNVD